MISLPTAVEQLVNTAELQHLVSDILIRAKKTGASSCEVDVGVSESLSVTVRKQTVETVTFHKDKSLSLTYYIGQKKSTVSTTDFSSASIDALLTQAHHLATIIESDPCHGLADPSLLATHIPDCELYHPWGIGAEEAVALAMRAEQAAFDYDARIINSDGATAYSTQGYHVYGNSHGFLAGYPSARHGLSCVMLGQDGGSMERDYEYTTARVPAQLETPEAVGKRTAEKVLARLNPKSLKTCQAPVMFHATLAGGLIGSYFSAISGSALFRKASFLCNSLHTQVFPNDFTIKEDPHILRGLGSMPFDNEGVAKRAMSLVENGTVQSYLLGSYSARKLNMQSTGHAGGVSNIQLRYPQQGSFEALLAQMDKGLLVTELMGQGTNMVTGDYSRGASGFWVEKGKVQYPVNEVTIASNLKNMLKGIVMLGTDIDKRSSLETGSILLTPMTIAGAG